jgi:hypothetical protein
MLDRALDAVVRQVKISIADMACLISLATATMAKPSIDRPAAPMKYRGREIDSAAAEASFWDGLIRTA